MADYYCVGFHWNPGDGDENHLDRFLQQGIWEHGFDDGRLDNRVNNVPVGAFIAAKTTHTEVQGDRRIGVLRVYNIGEVTANPKNGKTL